MSYNYIISVSTRGVVSGISINCQQLLSKFSPIRSTTVLIEQLCEENLAEQVMLNYYFFCKFLCKFYATARMHKNVICLDLISKIIKYINNVI